APAPKCSTPTATWRRSAKAALVGFGGLAGAGLRQTGRLLAHSPRATQRIATRWIPTPLSRDAHDRAARSGVYEHDVQRRDQIALRRRGWVRSPRRATRV